MGGSQTHLRQVLRILDRSRFDPILICLTGQGALLDDVRETGVQILSPAAERSFKGADLLVRMAATARVLRQARVDIVHTYLLRANLVGSVAARLARIPVVLGSKRGCHERRGFELLSAKIGNALSDRVMVNAEAVREFVHGNEGCPKDKMFVIPSGVDTDRFKPLPPADYKQRLGLPADAIIVGCVTRMRIRKGVEEFIRAIAELRRTDPRVHGVIAGEVEPDPYLQELLDELNMHEGLTLLGRRNDMPEVLSAFDLFVLSSHDEGMSNAILEAMAMEKAVVATDVGGTCEVVRHGQTGLLVPARDCHALAVAMGQVLSAPEKARAMGRLGRSVIEEGFSARSMVRQMEEVYLALAMQQGVRFETARKMA